MNAFEIKPWAAEVASIATVTTVSYALVPESDTAQQSRPSAVVKWGLGCAEVGQP